MLVKVGFYISFSFLFFVGFGQLTYIQDVFYGGVTGGSFSSGLGPGIGTIDVFIEPNSEIRDAFLIYNKLHNPEPCYILFEGHPIELSDSTLVTAYLIDNYPNIELSGVGVVDVKNFIDSSQHSYSVEIPNECFQGPEIQYNSVYLIITYDNPSLNRVSYNVFLNNETLETTPTAYYENEDLNPINVSMDVAFGINTDRLNLLSLNDGSEIFFNANSLGIVGGADNGSASGVKGDFHYSNGSLTGLNDDNPDFEMDSTDGISNVAPVLSNNASSINFSLVWQDQTASSRYNIYISFFLTHSTPCDTFSVNLQDKYQVCKGDSIQLQLTGGNDWEWEATGDNPQVGLSCYNCPQPYYTDTVSRWYTVRIWNNDSCSKVLPVRIEVVDNPAPPIVAISPTKCSDSSGVATVQVVEASHQYSINGGALQSNNAFTGLHAGNYNITVTDTNNCSTSTAVTVDMTYPTAQFAANPPQGDVPLAVEFINQSSGATNYEWYVNGDTLYDTSPQVTFNEGGVFTTTLIAYDTYPQCADTMSSVILTEYPFVVFAPSLHTDRSTPYQVYTTGVSEMTYELYNELGQLIINKKITPANGNNELWYPNQLAKGVYLYRIIAKNAKGNEKEFSGKVVWQ
ncbi:hypothetical protein [Parvicella tangerina]|uniref:T9SS C-terminal target domain-containing protein n=1 Tax=Parvicella tangerina TaxID=2829795 RepID=A0A916JPT4_9FLAO|nr:hypothetical protein [Parvicella tangerina]CAG5086572.1 hypothetical protein CRYO30217_03182 [Parvicella tangerina]